MLFMLVEGSVLVADSEQEDVIEDDGSEESKENEGCSEGREEDEERTEEEGGKEGNAEEYFLSVGVKSSNINIIQRFI